jgi:hypothetical protein
MLQLWMDRFVVIPSSLSAVGQIVAARRHLVGRRRISQRRHMVRWLDLLPWNRRRSVVTQFHRARVVGNRSAADLFSLSAHSLWQLVVCVAAIDAKMGTSSNTASSNAL